jgi:arylsulfatase A-like enzyme/Flp pilus assembly protein TadD
MLRARGPILFVTVALAFAFPATGCRARPKLDSVLLVTIDTLRADHVSCYGPSPVQTPALDALARRGARFTRAWTPIPLTTPAHATILTGLYPPGHGVRNNGRFGLPGDVTTLAKVLKAVGARTAAFVASFTTASLFGLNQGFDVYDDDLGNDAEGRRRLQRPGNEVVDRAVAWLAANASGPFFLWVHLYDPHFPYAPPPEYLSRYPNDPYSGDVAFADAELGRLIAALGASGAAPRTIVVALADHGEGLGTHDEDRHGLLLYEEAIRVPLLIVAPGRIEPGRQITTVASTVDVMPTVLHLLGREVPAGVHGRDLLVSGAEPRRVYAETLYPHEEFGWSALYAVREGDLKYIEGTTPELYDLASDPQERTDLTSSRRQEARRLQDALVTDASRIVNRERLTRVAGLGERSDAETLQGLAALGYVAGGPSSSPASETLPAIGGRSPREAMGDERRLRRAEQLVKGESFAEGIGILEQLAVSDADNPQVLLNLAQALAKSGDAAKAEARYRELLRRQPTFYLGYRYFTDFLEARGRAAEARSLWLDLQKRLPGYVEIQVRLARAEIAAAMPGDAVRRLGPYLENHPQDAEAWAQLGRALVLAGKDEDALKAFRYALDAHPTEREAVEGAVAILKTSGRTDEARRLVTELAARAPSDPLLRQTLTDLR